MCPEEINPVLCDHLVGLGGVGWGGRLQREGIYKHLRLIPIVAWQKQTQHCKASILQLRKKIIVLKSRSFWTLWEKARVG